MNIKHWIGISGASLALLLSGCTFGGEEDATPKVTDVEQKVQENPEELFFEFAQMSGKNGLTVLEKAIPNKEILRKVEGFFTVDGEFNLDGTPLGGGSGTFGIRVDSLADYTDAENIKAKDAFSIQADVMGGLFKIDTNGEVRVVKDSIYTQISNLDFNFPMIDAETEKMIVSFVGQWYGNTFEEINELVGDDSFNLKDIIVGPVNAVPELLIFAEDLLKNPKNHMVFNSYVKEEGGYYFFTATPKKESYKKLGDIVINTLPFPEYEKDSLQEMIDSLELTPLTIGYTPENSEYFKLSRVDGDRSVTLEQTADGVTFEIKEKGVATISFVYSNETKEFALTGTGSDTDEGSEPKVNTLAKGTWDGVNFSFEVFDPNTFSEENEFLVKGSAQYAEDGKKWSGVVESSQFPDSKLKFENFSFVASETQVFTGELQAIMEENTVAKITIASEMKVPGNVQIDVPENVKPFSSIPEDIAKMEEARYQKIQEELNQETDVLENTEENIDLILDEEVDDIPTPVVDESPVGGPDGNVVASQNNLNTTLQPLISELIRQMGESPTSENIAKAEELKNIIFSVGADEGLTPIEIQTLIQTELQKNPPLPQ